MLCEEYHLYKGHLMERWRPLTGFGDPQMALHMYNALLQICCTLLPNFTTNKGKAPIQGGTGTTKGEDLSPSWENARI